MSCRPSILSVSAVEMRPWRRELRLGRSISACRPARRCVQEQAATPDVLTWSGRKHTPAQASSQRFKVKRRHLFQTSPEVSFTSAATAADVETVRLELPIGVFFFAFSNIRRGQASRWSLLVTFCSSERTSSRGEMFRSRFLPLGLQDRSAGSSAATSCFH